MLFDVRTYTCKPGMIKRHLALYQQKAYRLLIGAKLHFDKDIRH